MKEKNGITLIALIITIIVMLILVAVTITMAVNGGLFGYAGNAARDTELAKNKELKLANLSSGMSTDQLIAKYTTEEIEEVHNWTRGTGANIDKFTCSHCNLEVEMGQIVEYLPNTVTTPVTVSGTDSGVSAGITAENLNAGDFGTEGLQQIPQESLTWVVLEIEDQNSNGINETLLITSATPTNNTLTLFGAAAYNNGPRIMNKVCKDLYSNTTYGNARSMTIEDVNRAVNWTDTRGMYWDTNNNAHKVDAGTKFGDLPPAVKSVITTNGTSTPYGTSLDNCNIDGYGYYILGNYLVDDSNDSSTSNPITEREKAIIFGNGNYLHWLTSRGCTAWANYGRVYFGAGYVENNSAGSSRGYFTSSEDQYSDYLELRPVVSLTSSIPTVTQNIYSLD